MIGLPSLGQMDRAGESGGLRIWLATATTDNRKNSLFVGNQRGGHTAAALSSITSTCRRHEIDPQRYLTQLLANLPTTPLSQLDQ